MWSCLCVTPALSKRARERGRALHTCVKIRKWWCLRHSNRITTRAHWKETIEKRWYAPKSGTSKQRQILTEKLNFRNITGAAIWTHHKQSYYNYYHETIMGPAFPTNLPQETAHPFLLLYFKKLQHTHMRLKQFYDQLYSTPTPSAHTFSQVVRTWRLFLLPILLLGSWFTLFIWCSEMSIV